MADTNLQIFINGVASYLASAIFPSIIQGFAAKGVVTSVEELLAMTQTPAPRIAPAVVTPTVPAMAFGGVVPTMAPAIAPTAGRKAAATATPTPVAGRCNYQFK